MQNINWQKVLLWGAFIFYLAFLLLRQETAINQDLGRHLRLGEMILTNNEQRECALFKNCLTYTYPDYPFVNHHWGAEVIFYWIYKFGGFEGLIVLKAIVLGMAFWITARHAINESLRGMSRRMTRQSAAKNRFPRNVPCTFLGMTIAIIFIFLSIQMMADRLTMRPEIFGYLLFAILFWKLNRGIKGIWGILGVWGIMLLWVNLHISFIFGVGLIWIRAISNLASKGYSLPGREYPSKANREYFLIAVIAMLITVVNPNRIRGAIAPLNIFKGYGYTIAENMTPFFMARFRPQSEYWIYGGLLVAALLLWGVKGFRGIGGFESTALIAFSVFPLMAVRHLPFFALIIPIMLTPLLFNLLQKVPYLTKVRYLTGYVVGGLILLAFVNPVPLADAKLSPIGLDADKRHEAAILFVKENNLQGNMWNNYDIGSYLEWKLPEYKTFVDGRPEAFPVEFFRNVYKPMQEKPEIWDEEMGKYDIQWIFAALTDATPWFQKWWVMIQIHPDWKIVYLDDYSAVLIKKNGINNHIDPVGKAKTMEIIKNSGVLY